MDYRIEAETAQEDIRNALQILADAEKICEVRREAPSLVFASLKVDGLEVMEMVDAVRIRLESALRKLDVPDIGPAAAPREDRMVLGVPVEGG